MGYILAFSQSLEGRVSSQKEKNIAQNHNSFLFLNCEGRKMPMQSKEKQFSHGSSIFGAVCFPLEPKKETLVSNMRKTEKENIDSDLFILLTT